MSKPWTSYLRDLCHMFCFWGASGWTRILKVAVSPQRSSWMWRIADSDGRLHSRTSLGIHSWRCTWTVSNEDIRHFPSACLITHSRAYIRLRAGILDMMTTMETDSCVLLHPPHNIQKRLNEWRGEKNSYFFPVWKWPTLMHIWRKNYQNPNFLYRVMTWATLGIKLTTFKLNKGSPKKAACPLVGEF